MPSHTIPTRYEDDLEAELADERHRRALQRLTVGDLLGEVDALIREEMDECRHPLYPLAKHVLRHGGYRQTGQRTTIADFLTARYEDLFDLAVTRLVAEELSNFGPWED